MEYIWLKFFGYLIASAALYLFANARPSKYHWELPIDKKIRMVPIFIIPYLFLYPLIPMTFFLLVKLNNNNANDYLNALIIVQLLAFIFWFLFPNGVKRTSAPPIKLGKIINFIYAHDNDTNGFPSGHVFMSLISVYYAFQADMIIGVFMAIIGIAIILSTVFIKQHYIVDVFGGAAFAAMSIFLTLLL